jgi:hypothetical protein
VKAVFLLIFAALLFAAPVNDRAAPSGEAWLKLVDGGKYADSWKEASSYFRSGVPEKTWVSMVQGAHAPLGSLSLVSRSQPSITFAKTLPGVPDGNYALMQFQTSFQGRWRSVARCRVLHPLSEPHV